MAAASGLRSDDHPSYFLAKSFDILASQRRAIACHWMEQHNYHIEYFRDRLIYGISRHQLGQSIDASLLDLCCAGWNDYFIRFPITAAETLNYVGLAQHNFGSAGFTLTVYGASSASPADLYAITDSVAVTNDKPIIFQFAEQAPATIYLRIQGLDSPPSQYASCAVMYVGLLLTMERSVRIDVNHTPINLGTVSNVVSGMSESGQFVGRIVRNQYQESKADFYYFTDSWYRDSFDPFVISAVDNPFFIAWAPDDWPEDVGYCWLTKDPKPEMHLPTEAFIVSLEMRGIA